jgi:hypothetical protein
MHADCPNLWASKIQIKIALLSTEGEYVAVSYAAREIVPLVSVFEKIGCERLILLLAINDTALVRYTLFEYNRQCYSRMSERCPRSGHERNTSTLSITTFGNTY